MFTKIEALCQELSGDFTRISSERKILLNKIADAISNVVQEEKPVDIVYICTHNSRRSHFGQIWGKVAADFYGIETVNTFSAGTEATAFHLNAIKAIQSQGFVVSQRSEGKNPMYSVQFGDHDELTCFSKVVDDASLPSERFIAIMTCSDADENCPFVSGTLHRFATTYEDPKVADGTDIQEERYLERANQIARESLFLFHRVKSLLTK